MWKSIFLNIFRRGHNVRWISWLSNAFIIATLNNIVSLWECWHEGSSETQQVLSTIQYFSFGVPVNSIRMIFEARFGKCRNIKYFFVTLSVTLVEYEKKSNRKEQRKIFSSFRVKKNYRRNSSLCSNKSLVKLQVNLSYWWRVARNRSEKSKCAIIAPKCCLRLYTAAL